MAAFTSMLIAGAAIAGVGMTYAGMQQQREAASQQAEAQQEMIRQQQRQERIRQRAMELDARRRQMEMLRNQQRARSLALATTTAQGASQGSGLAGAYGQISGATGFNMLGVSQNLALGREMFGSNLLESQAKMGYAQAGSDYMAGQGLTSLGGMVIGNLGTIGNLAGNFSGFGSRIGGYAQYGTNPFTPSGGINPYYR
jgi:hypothetical protein